MQISTNNNDNNKQKLIVRNSIVVESFGYFVNVYLAEKFDRFSSSWLSSKGINLFTWSAQRTINFQYLFKKVILEIF